MPAQQLADRKCWLMTICVPAVMKNARPLGGLLSPKLPSPTTAATYVRSIMPLSSQTRLVPEILGLSGTFAEQSSMLAIVCGAGRLVESNSFFTFQDAV